MTVPSVSNQRQKNSNCTVRQTRSLSLPTQAYNSSHFYMVRLVWFPGYMDWERTLWEIYEGKRGRSRSEVAQRVSLVNITNCDVTTWSWVNLVNLLCEESIGASCTQIGPSVAKLQCDKVTLLSSILRHHCRRQP